MTSTVLAATNTPEIDMKATTAGGPPPRKRRRRTAGGGASDDCFTCRNRGAQCDRKRPYCTQCIDIGKECSGYPTTLTWGVGVASRGKLRGLSCPIANKNVDGTDLTSFQLESRRRKSTAVRAKKEESSTANAVSSPLMNPRPAPTPTSAPQHATTYPPMVPPSPTGWHIPGFGEHIQSRQAGGLRHHSLQQPPLQHLHTSRQPRFDGVDQPTSGRSTGSYNEAQFHTPMEYTRVSGAPRSYSEQLPHIVSVSFPEQPMTASSVDSFRVNDSSLDSYADRMRPSVPSSQSQTMILHNGAVESSQPMLGTLGGVSYGRNDPLMSSIPHLTYSPATTEMEMQSHEAGDDERQLSLLNARFGSPFFQVSPRLQALMDFYDRHVCPYLVAFDSPENPYRKHVLRLALNNESLRNAIAALSTNNWRMRKKNLKRGGFIETMSGPFSNPYNEDLSEPTPEETCYKQMAIDHLNVQLLDTRAAQDDSVLATLVILCLFHVCDCGFTKFKTQLAGVQKLLSLRDPNTRSDFTGWVEMFFTWFDVMTSTVNDRETQLMGSSPGMLEFSASLGTSEQFAGCDSHLFSIIARLGKLNLLAQGRTVRSQVGNQQIQRRPLPQTLHGRYGRKRPGSTFMPTKSLSPADYENIDGNGWGTPIISSDDDADGSADEHITQFDDRHTFWAEWQDIRRRLLAWQMDAQQLVTPVSPSAPNDAARMNAPQADLVHINESFRYAAMLYTERLGQPLLPSSHLRFQNLVSQGLYHITALPVTSHVNKFLLWPLFIIGTECVNEAHRNIIRNRCRDLTEESGFFNNMSSLDVLEKVWNEVGHNVRGSEAEEVRARRRESEASTSGQYGQAFRWRKAMDRIDGEYIVI